MDINRLAEYSVMGIICLFFKGYVLSVLWKWFIVPLFNVPKLKLAAAIGIVAIATILTHQYLSNPYEEMFIVAIILLTGRVIELFM